MCAGEQDRVSCKRSSSELISLHSDIVERFSLTLMLSLIAGRNLIEIIGSDVDFDPRSLLRGKGLLQTIMSVS